MVRVAILILLFIPSLWFAYEYRDMPSFGYYHDDGLYFVGAKTLAQSGSYRIASFPGEPAQTKYPPLLSAWHALAWWIQPDFPATLGVAIWLQWIWLPVFAWLTWILLKDWGMSGNARFIVMVMFALSPYLLFFSTAILSEIPFGVFVAATMLLLNRGRIIPAALCAGLAYLTRTAGIVLIVSVPAVLWIWEKRRKEAVQFAVTLLPFIAAWMLWSKANRPASPNELLLYLTDYLGYHFGVFTLGDAHLFLWKNADMLLQAAGAFILPLIYGGQIATITTQVMGVAAIAGAVRLTLAPHGRARQFGIFAGIYAAILLLWSFPPNERFLLPLAPFFLAGFVVEFSRVFVAMRKSFQHKDASQRGAAYGIAAFVALLLLFCLYTQLQVRYELMPLAMAKERERTRDLAPMYQWIRANTPETAKFLVGYDTVFHLHTGRHGSYQSVSPIGWYRDSQDPARFDAEAYARKYGFDLILWTPTDRRNDATFEEQVAIGRKLADSKTLKLLHEERNAYLFALLPVDGKRE
ncbi:hypothetical protein F183_A19660 [Bryobacterales bacterium F-183]|nr:hypothetical protein F183_A19660 [Bryobacterales bacterium F-183]